LLRAQVRRCGELARCCMRRGGRRVHERSPYSVWVDPYKDKVS
jgi:hypothetical protein